MEKINWGGAFALYKKEVMRFIKVYHQTVITPVISSVIFLLIFKLAVGSSKTQINNINFSDYLVYGLIMSSILQNSFANSSSSFIMSRVIGYIEDIITPPLSGFEIVVAMSFGAMLRGIIVGFCVFLAFIPVANYHIYHFFTLVYFTLSACLLFGQLGILSGIICDSFEQNAMVTNYLINPLSLLSGTFYSVKTLPIFFQKLNLVNPFFYMIDGFRYCFTDISDSNVSFGIVFVLFINIALFFVLVKLINIGYNLKK